MSHCDETESVTPEEDTCISCVTVMRQSHVTEEEEDRETESKRRRERQSLVPFVSPPEVYCVAVP
jgi:hypothetical protein